MENDIRKLIKERLISSNVELSVLFDGKGFDHEQLRRLFPMLSTKLLRQSDKFTSTMLAEADASACQRICASKAYQEFISKASNPELCKQIDLSLKRCEMSLEQCYKIVKDILPSEIELHEQIDPRGNFFLKNITISYVLNSVLYLLLDNDPYITVTWGPYIGSDDSEIKTEWLGKSLLLNHAQADGFDVVNGIEYETFECYTNQVNQKLINELKNSLSLSVFQKLKRRLF
ncbi:hypothetical protein [Vibrio diazotrophicus]|uniref:hypothetical protein n=1 Tax=Vibrio diazotrophicus TaxID=685 RepID=UPI000C9EB21A|nr:hypothetical protein [Vibrio diazotrophicus]PNH98565.1 hypothetical protein C1O24_00535 [Vibrio diazotrophicus]